MSQADELLESLLETEDMPGSGESEPHIVIGRDRKITVPEGLKKLAVQYDHGVETVTFDCPRYWDEHDFLNMFPYVNYVCADGSHGTCPAVNVVPDPDDPLMFRFDWIVSEGVTKANGRVAILVCIKSADGQVHWNSEKNDELYITEGLECVEDVVESYPDQITMILKRMADLEYIGLTHRVSVDDIDGGYRITLNDAGGEHICDILHGTPFTWDDLTDDQKAELRKGIAGVDANTIRGLIQEELSYEPIDITSFGHGVGIKEYGAKVLGVTLRWKVNRTSDDEYSLTLSGPGLEGSIDVTGMETYPVDDLSITMNNSSSQKWILTATDERGSDTMETTAIVFYNGVYYGVAEEPKSYTSQFIIDLGKQNSGLNKKLTGSKVKSFTVTASEGKYIYYCLPVRYGTCSFSIGVMPGGFQIVNTITFENESGHKEPYYIYRSDYANLGTRTIAVS
jgi:hypothetical protein